MYNPHVTTKPLEHNITQIDLMYSASPRLCAGYIIGGPVPVLIETGPKPSVPYILEALKVLKIEPSALRYIIVTHIHLDHAGGAGTLLKHCPNATLLVHEKGRRHLIDPDRLLSGARQVYGEAFDSLLEDIEPVQAERIISPQNNQSIDIGSGRMLTFINTPGHAYHHLCIYDSLSQGIFCGDAAGLSFPVLAELGTEYYVPATSPTQFDPTAMLISLNHISAFKPRHLYFTHFGVSSHPAQIIRSLRELIQKWLELAADAYLLSSTWQDIETALWQYHECDLIDRGIPAGHPALATVKDTLEISAKGLAHYLENKNTK